jgi:Kef-type K+ transport system membrane component KefB
MSTLVLALLSKSKICYLDVVIAGYQDILALEVSMTYNQKVEVVYSRYELHKSA